VLGDDGDQALAFGWVQVSEPPAEFLAQRVQIQLGFWAGRVAGMPIAPVLAKKSHPQGHTPMRHGENRARAPHAGESGEGRYAVIRLTR